MSIGNTNFITLDSIAEIQDIVNGDYLFTVSDGVIYKLDFQNLILTADNVDFYSTIESLSSQVVSLTNAFSAINTTVNELSTLSGVGTLVRQQSANWNSTYTTVQKLSSTHWLPTNDVKSGSLVRYAGGASSWKVIEPGLEGDMLQVRNNVPIFTGTTGLYSNIDEYSNTFSSINTDSRDDTIPLISMTTGGAEYSYIGIQWEVAFNGGVGDQTTNKSALLIQFDDGRDNLIVTAGSFAIPKGTDGNALPINFTVIPQADFGNFEYYGIRPGTSARRDLKNMPLGSYTALGSNAPTAINQTSLGSQRPYDFDPLIIQNVLTSQFSEFLNLIPLAGGLPSSWRIYPDARTHNDVETPTLWDTANVMLRIYGTGAAAPAGG